VSESRAKRITENRDGGKAMSVTVEFSYDMGKEFGERRLDVSDAATVKDLIARLKKLFEERGKSLPELSRVTAVAVNGVLVKHKKGMKTKLADGDTVAFVKAAAGG